MKELILFATLVVIVILYFLPSNLKYVELNKIEQYVDSLVTTSGFVHGKTLCSGSKCIKVIGAKYGPQVLTGNVQKQNGEVILFVKRIE